MVMLVMRCFVSLCSLFPSIYHLIGSRCFLFHVPWVDVVAVGLRPQFHKNCVGHTPRNSDSLGVGRGPKDLYFY